MIEDKKKESEMQPESRSDHWYKIEYLLKNHLTIRRNASMTIRELMPYINPADGTVNMKDELLEASLSPKTDYAAIRVQGGTHDGDSKTIHIVEQLSYSNESVQKRYLWAKQQVLLLDQLAEEIDFLPARQAQVIKTLYYTYEGDPDNPGATRAMRYETARNLLGYGSTTSFERMRKEGIDLLTEKMMSPVTPVRLRKEVI